MLTELPQGENTVRRAVNQDEDTHPTVWLPDLGALASGPVRSIRVVSRPRGVAFGDSSPNGLKGVG